MAGVPSRVTGADVARAAGVSQATVSYVLSGNTRQSIPATTRKRILDAADRLGYVPHVSARALRTGQSSVVVLTLPVMSDSPTMSDMIESASAALGRQGFTLLTYVGGERPSAATLLASVAPAAVLALRPFPATELARFRGAGVRLVVPYAETTRDGGWADWIDWGPTAQLQVDHLISRGRRRIGFAASAEFGDAPVVRRRIATINHALEEHGLEPVSLRTMPSDPAAIIRALREWREDVPDLDGICAHTDSIAIGVLYAARELGLSVPDDIGVVGADDLPFSAMVVPALTTVRPNNLALGENIATAVVNYLREDRTLEAGRNPITVSRPVSLVVRQSA
ncbi:MAG: LacI family DNA-binding transcriptional regulator [Microbacterium sp.]|nr:LacI family DNA-binding transcriptional regulator [Microbacterium sp.]